MIDQEFHDDLIAELLALNQIVHQTLSHLARLSGDKRAFLNQELERGLSAIEKTELWSTPTARRAMVTEKARARFSEIVTSVPTD